MLLEFLNRQNEPGIIPELVKVDGVYAIRHDDVIFSLDGEKISSYDSLEIVNEISSDTDRASRVDLVMATWRNEPRLLLIFSDPSKKPENYSFNDYFGTFAHEEDEYFESMEFVELTNVGRVQSPSVVDYKTERKNVSISSLDFLASHYLRDFRVVTGDSKLIHCGVNPQWNSLIVFAGRETTSDGERLRVRTFNAEIYAFSSYQDESALITSSKDFVSSVLEQFTYDEIRSGEKVVKEYERVVNSSTRIGAFTVSSFIGVKLRPSKVFTCDVLTDEAGDPIVDFQNDDVLNALELTGVMRELISKVQSENALTLVWRDRDAAHRFWVVTSGEDMPTVISVTQ